MSNIQRFSSRKEVTEFLAKKGIDTSNWSEVKWLQINKGQAEIHMMALAEVIYDAMQESTPKQLQPGEWHIPFEDKLSLEEIAKYMGETGLLKGIGNTPSIINKNRYAPEIIKISTAMAARTSYTVVGDEKEIDYNKMIELHDRLINQDPLHASPMEHCARAMSDEEYHLYRKGILHEDINIDLGNTAGWCRNYKGFIQYRHMLEK